MNKYSAINKLAILKCRKAILKPFLEEFCPKNPRQDDPSAGWVLLQTILNVSDRCVSSLDNVHSRTDLKFQQCYCEFVNTELSDEKLPLLIECMHVTGSYELISQLNIPATIREVFLGVMDKPDMSFANALDLNDAVVIHKEMMYLFVLVLMTEGIVRPDILLAYDKNDEDSHCTPLSIIELWLAIGVVAARSRDINFSCYTTKCSEESIADHIKVLGKRPGSDFALAATNELL